MGYGTGFGVGGWLGVLGIVLLIVGVVVLVVWLAGRQGTPVAAPPRPTAADPLQILQTRFARGEIGRDEYLTAKQTLETDR